MHITAERNTSMDGEYKRFITESLENIRIRIKKAISERPSEYSSESVKLMAASKTVCAEALNFAARELGLNCIGENKVQELCEKYDALDKDALELQFIGSLQTNKVKYIVDKVSLIHSLDREELAKEISKRALKIKKVMPVLVEINIAREPDKGGIMPEELSDFLEFTSKLEGIKAVGLMTMAPPGCTTCEYEHYFSQVRKMYLAQKEKPIPNTEMRILSMGMSNSFEEAIRCGANLVRVGSAIFGKRNYNADENGSTR